ncbi:MAG: ABC transporter permease [Deltaproteobacteria bacterium]|nr:ABC transporter permease [Deltaproteobacteria bacterium]MBW1963248.1 ABC transporter permease [Deltaproteobacteria bacterium]MBW2153697.1 ABC transporter permease [Deltaproteobacteria bacterium]
MVTESYARLSKLHIVARHIVKHIMGVFGLTVTAIMVFTAIFAPMLAPYDPYEQNLMKRLQPPFWYPEGNMDHLLGTDHVGRDLLSRLIYGARISLSVGVFAVLIAATIGVILGLLAGYYMGKVDAVISYLIDMMMSFPYVLLAMALVATLGASFRNVFIVLGVTSWPLYARVIRAEVLRIKEMDYIQSARAIGMNDLRIIVQEVTPNLFNSIIVICTVQTAAMIISESFLSFLGMGVQPPIPSWGGMLSEGRAYMLELGWLAALPGMTIFLTTMGINLLGDGLRDFFDPFKRQQQ